MSRVQSPFLKFCLKFNNYDLAPQETIKAVDKKEKSEEKEEKEKSHDDTPSEGEQIDEEAVSEEVAIINIRL